MASLKLFRSTGYSSLYSAGESRVAIHPSVIVAAVSLWVGFACNVQLWRELEAFSSGAPHRLVNALALGAFIAADCAIVLSLLGWHKTLKPAATLLLVLAAFSAAAIWGQAIPIDASLSERRLSQLLIPTWASFLRWQVSALIVGLALLPIIWLWQARVRRLSGPRQLHVNVVATLASCAVIAVSGFMLSRSVF